MKGPGEEGGNIMKAYLSYNPDSRARSNASTLLHNK